MGNLVSSKILTLLNQSPVKFDWEQSSTPGRETSGDASNSPDCFNIMAFANKIISVIKPLLPKRIVKYVLRYLYEDFNDSSDTILLRSLVMGRDPSECPPAGETHRGYSSYAEFLHETKKVYSTFLALFWVGSYRKSPKPHKGKSSGGDDVFQSQVLDKLKRGAAKEDAEGSGEHTLLLQLFEVILGNLRSATTSGFSKSLRETINKVCNSVEKYLDGQIAKEDKTGRRNPNPSLLAVSVQRQITLLVKTLMEICTAQNETETQQIVIKRVLRLNHKRSNLQGHLEFIDGILTDPNAGTASLDGLILPELSKDPEANTKVTVPKTSHQELTLVLSSELKNHPVSQMTLPELKISTAGQVGILIFGDFAFLATLDSDKNEITVRSELVRNTGIDDFEIDLKPMCIGIHQKHLEVFGCEAYEGTSKNHKRKLVVSKINLPTSTMSTTEQQSKSSLRRTTKLLSKSGEFEKSTPHSALLASNSFTIRAGSHQYHLAHSIHLLGLDKPACLNFIESADGTQFLMTLVWFGKKSSDGRDGSSKSNKVEREVVLVNQDSTLPHKWYNTTLDAVPFDSIEAYVCGDSVFVADRSKNYLVFSLESGLVLKSGQTPGAVVGFDHLSDSVILLMPQELASQNLAIESLTNYVPHSVPAAKVPGTKQSKQEMNIMSELGFGPSISLTAPNTESTEPGSLWGYMELQSIPLLKSIEAQSSEILSAQTLCQSLTRPSLISPLPGNLTLYCSILSKLLPLLSINRTSNTTKPQIPLQTSKALISAILGLTANHLGAWRVILEHSPSLLAESSSHEALPASACTQLIKDLLQLKQVESLHKVCGSENMSKVLRIEREILTVVGLAKKSELAAQINSAYLNSGVLIQSDKRLAFYTSAVLASCEGRALGQIFTSAELLQNILDNQQDHLTSGVPSGSLHLKCLEQIMSECSNLFKPILNQETSQIVSLLKREPIGIIADNEMRKQRTNAISVIRELLQMLHLSDLAEDKKFALLKRLDSSLELISSKFREQINSRTQQEHLSQTPTETALIQACLIDSFGYKAYNQFSGHFRFFPNMLQRLTELGATGENSNYLSAGMSFALMICELNHQQKKISQTGQSTVSRPLKLHKTMGFKVHQSENPKYRIVKLDPFQEYLLAVEPSSDKCADFSLVVFRTWYYDTPISGKSEFDGQLLPKDIVPLDRTSCNGRFIKIRGCWQIGLMVAPTKPGIKDPISAAYRELKDLTAEVKIFLEEDAPAITKAANEIVTSVMAQINMKLAAQSKDINVFSGYKISQKTPGAQISDETLASIKKAIGSYNPSNQVFKVLLSSISKDFLEKILAFVCATHSLKEDQDWNSVLDTVLQSISALKRKSPGSAATICTPQSLRVLDGFDFAPQTQSLPPKETISRLLKYLEKPYTLSITGSNMVEEQIDKLFARAPEESLHLALKHLDKHGVLATLLKAGYPAWKLLAGFAGQTKIKLNLQQSQEVLKHLSELKEPAAEVSTKVEYWTAYFGLVWKAVVGLQDQGESSSEQETRMISEQVLENLQAIETHISNFETSLVTAIKLRTGKNHQEWDSLEKLPPLAYLLEVFDHGFSSVEIQKVMFNTSHHIGTPLASHSVSANDSIVSFKSNQSNNYQSENEASSSGNGESSGSSDEEEDCDNNDDSNSGSGSSSSSNSRSRSADRGTVLKSHRTDSDSESSASNRKCTPRPLTVPAPLPVAASFGTRPVPVPPFTTNRLEVEMIKSFSPRCSQPTQSFWNNRGFIAPDGLGTGRGYFSSNRLAPSIDHGQPETMIGLLQPPVMILGSNPVSEVIKAIWSPSDLLLLSYYTKLTEYRILQLTQKYQAAKSENHPTETLVFPLPLRHHIPFTSHALVRLPRLPGVLAEHVCHNVLQLKLSGVYKYKAARETIGAGAHVRFFVDLVDGTIRGVPVSEGPETGYIEASGQKEGKEVVPLLRTIIDARKYLTEANSLQAAHDLCRTQLPEYANLNPKRTAELMLVEYDILTDYLFKYSTKYSEHVEQLTKAEPITTTTKKSSKFELLRSKVTGKHQTQPRLPLDTPTGDRVMTPLLEFSHPFIHQGPEKTSSPWVAGLDGSAYSPEMYAAILGEAFCRTIEDCLVHDATLTDQLSLGVWRRVALHHLRSVKLPVKDISHKVLVIQIQHDAKLVEGQLRKSLEVVRLSGLSSNNLKRNDQFTVIGQILFGRDLITASRPAANQGLLFYFDCIYELLHHNLEAEVHKYKILADLFAAYQHHANSLPSRTASSEPETPPSLLSTRVKELADLLSAIRVVSNDSTLSWTLNLTVCVEQIIRVSIEKKLFVLEDIPADDHLTRQFFKEQASMEYALQNIQQDTFQGLEDLFARACLIREVNKEVKYKLTDDDNGNEFPDPPVITDPAELEKRFEGPPKKLPDQREIVLVPWIPQQVDLSGHGSWSMNNFQWLKLPEAADFKPAAPPKEVSPNPDLPSVPAKKARKKIEKRELSNSGTGSSSGSNSGSDDSDADSGTDSEPDQSSADTQESVDSQTNLRTPHEHLMQIYEDRPDANDDDSAYFLFEQRPYCLGQLELAIVGQEAMRTGRDRRHQQEMLDPMKNYHSIASSKVYMQYPASRKHGLVLMARGGGLDTEAMALLNRYYNPDRQINTMDPIIWNQDDEQMKFMVLQGSLYWALSATHPNYVDVFDYNQTEFIFWCSENQRYHYIATFDSSICQEIRSFAKYDRVATVFEGPIASEVVKLVAFTKNHFIALYANGLAAKISLIDKSRTWVGKEFKLLHQEMLDPVQEALYDGLNQAVQTGTSNQDGERNIPEIYTEKWSNVSDRDQVKRFTIWNFKKHHVVDIFATPNMIVLLTAPPEHPTDYILKVYFANHSDKQTPKITIPRAKVIKSHRYYNSDPASICILFDNQKALLLSDNPSHHQANRGHVFLDNVVDFAYWEQDPRLNNTTHLVVLQKDPDVEEFVSLQYVKDIKGKMKQHHLNKVFDFTTESKLHCADYPFFARADPKPQLLFTPEYNRLVEYPLVISLDSELNLDVTYLPADPSFYQKFLDAEDVNEGGFSILLTRAPKIQVGDQLLELQMSHMQMIEQALRFYQQSKEAEVDPTSKEQITDKIVIKDWSGDLLGLDTKIDWSYKDPKSYQKPEGSDTLDIKPVPQVIFRFKGKVKKIYADMIAQTSLVTHPRNLACKALRIYPGFQDMAGQAWLDYKEASKDLWKPMLDSLTPAQWIKARDTLVELTYGSDTDFNIYIQEVFSKESQINMKKNLFHELLKKMPSLKNQTHLLPAHLELLHSFLVICNDWRYFAECRMIVLNQSVYFGLEKARPNLFGFAFNETRLAPDYCENSDQLELQVDRYRAEQVTPQNQNMSFLNQLYFQMLDKTAWNPESLIKRNALQFAFVGEDGYDAGGLFKEYFSHLGTEVTKTLKLFVPSPNFGEVVEESNRLIPNFRLTSQRDLTNLRAVGLAIGTMYRLFGSTDLDLPSSLWKYLMKIPFTWHDYAQIDNRLYKLIERIPTMSEEDIKALNLTFSYAVPDLGGSSANPDDSFVIDLLPNGRTIEVTKQTSLLYCALMQNLLLEQITIPYEEIRTGFLMNVHGELLHYVSPGIIESAVTGDKIVDVQWLKTAVRDSDDYEEENGEEGSGPTPAEKEIRSKQKEMFWSVLESLSQEELAKYMRFVTGSSRINKTMTTHSVNFETTPNLIPVAHTCSNGIDIGTYPSAEELKAKLLYAMDNHHGFLENGFEGGKKIHYDYDLLESHQHPAEAPVSKPENRVEEMSEKP